MTTLTLAQTAQNPRLIQYRWSGSQDAATDDLEAVIPLGGRLLQRATLHIVATGAAAAGSTGRLRVLGRPDLTSSVLEHEVGAYRGLTTGYIGVTGSTGATYAWLTLGTSTNLWPAITSAVGAGVYQAGGLFDACFGGLLKAALTQQDEPAPIRLHSLRLLWTKGDLTAGMTFSSIGLFLCFAEA